MKRVLLSFVIVAGLAFGTTSCSKAKDSAKKAGDAVENAAEKTGDAVKQAAEKTKEAVKEGAEAVKEGAEKAVDAVTDNAQVEKGKALFTSKTCATCHGVDKKVLGPSIKNIVKVYSEKGANMVKFLKGNSAPIVDTDPGQVAIMKANVDGFLKDMKAEELQAVTAYMRSVGK